MNCPSCGHESPDHAKFCLECAEPVASGEPRPERKTATPRVPIARRLDVHCTLRGRQSNILASPVEGSRRPW